MRKNKKLNFIAFLFICFGTLFVGRVFYIQFFYKDKLSQFADRQFVKKIKIQNRRGSIVDRNGESLAVSVKAYSIFVDPKLIENKYIFSKNMAKELNLSSSKLLSEINKNKNSRFLWIKRQISLPELEKLKQSKVADSRGWGVVTEYKRKYLENGVAAPLLGYVSIDGKGLDGLEYSFNKSLSGAKSEWVRLEKDAKGRSIFSDDEKLYLRKKSGENLQLTISRKLQALVEDELNKAVQEHHATGAQALVLNPRNGEILAWGQAPSFNPEQFTAYSQSRRTNHILTAPVEPGSVIKPFLIAQALDKNVLEEWAKIRVPDAKLKIKNKTFQDASLLKRDEFTLEDILVYSSNIGIISVQQKIGAIKLRKLFQDIGFQNRVLSLPGESNGVLSWYPESKTLEYATMSFGQGFSITPLQLLRAFSVFARQDGAMVTPKIFKNDHDVNHQMASEVLTKVFSQETVKTVRGYLKSVVERGTGRSAALEGIAVAGKTGTAQKLLRDEKGKAYYSDKEYRASFIGYFPAEAPRFLIYTMIDGAQRGGHGGATAAAPLFKKIAQHALWISPDQIDINNEMYENSFETLKKIQPAKTLAR